MTGYQSKKDMAQDKLDSMEREALKLALEALKEISRHATTPWEDEWCGELADETLTAINALAQPAQEPVCPECKAEVLYECVACSSNNYPPKPAQEPVGEVKPVIVPPNADADEMNKQHGDAYGVDWKYPDAAQPQRTWVDLTDDEEIADYLGDEYHTMTESDLRFFRLGVAAAKEKNT